KQGDTTREIALTVTARVVTEVSVQPPLLALHVENALRQEITVTDRRSPALRVTAAKASTPAVKVTLLPQGGGVTRIAIDVAGADLPAGRQEATIDIVTDDPLYRHLQVPVTLVRAPRRSVTATPEEVHFDPRGDQVRSQLLRLRPTGEGKVIVA